MQTGSKTSITRNWIWAGLLLIVIAIGPSLVGIQLVTPIQKFVWGFLIGLAIFFFGAFIYLAGKEWFGKSQ